MRILSVKETAQALGISVRTVQYRLQNGDLKGMRTPNQYGVKEWRVWPNKEIIDRLGPGKGTEDYFEEPTEEFLGGDGSSVIDAEEIEAGENFGDNESPVKVLVRELTQQFAEQLSREKDVLLMLQRELEEKNRQLRLLPDLEKEAELRRKNAELKELEAEALRKQVNALQEKEETRNSELERLKKVEHEVLPDLERRLEEERAQKEAKLAESQRQLEVLERERRKAEESERRVEDLEKTLNESQLKAAAEIQRLQEEKDAQAKAIQEQLQALSTTVQELRQPWYKKIFGSVKS